MKEKCNVSVCQYQGIFEGFHLPCSLAKLGLQAVSVGMLSDSDHTNRNLPWKVCTHVGLGVDIGRTSVFLSISYFNGQRGFKLVGFFGGAKLQKGQSLPTPWLKSL